MATVFLGWLKTLCQKDWFLGFIGGVIATVLGCFLTFAWEVYKSRRDIRDRDEIIMRALNEEIGENNKLVARNMAYIRQELAVLSDNKSVVDPLVPLKTGFWDIVKINLPRALLSGGRLLKLRNIALLAETTNEQIRSRENYRINNGSMSNFSSRIRLYDESLKQSLKDVKAAIGEYEKDVTSATVVARQ